MDSSSSGPPNPREARYRKAPASHWSGYPVTITLIAICLLVGLVSQLGYHQDPVKWMFFSNPAYLEMEDQLLAMEEAGQADTDAYLELHEQYLMEIDEGASATKEVFHGQLWRLVTPMFLHFGPIHLGFNMLWLWTLGRMLEPVLRRGRFLLMVLIIAIVSNTAEAIISGPNFGGMSGVIYGLFGFVVVLGKLKPTPGVHLDSSTVRYMLIWLVLCFTGFLGPIANWAHSFGLASGAAIGAIHALRNGGIERLRRRQEFRRAIHEVHTSTLHECTVCGRTEHHDRDLEFRVGTDGNEYCVEHLPENNGG